MLYITKHTYLLFYFFFFHPSFLGKIPQNSHWYHLYRNFEESVFLHFEIENDSYRNSGRITMAGVRGRTRWRSSLMTSKPQLQQIF